GARAERDHQGERLEDQHQQQDSEREAGSEDVTDSVVADAEDAWHKVTDDAERQPAHSRPPKGIEGQTLELVFDPVEQLAETNRGKSADNAQDDIKRQPGGQAKIHGPDAKHWTAPQQRKVAE